MTNSTRIDPDLSFSLVDGSGSLDNRLFSINGNQLILESPVDYETKSTYNLRIMSSLLMALFLRSRLKF